MSNKNILINNSLYPEAHRVFSIAPLSIEKIKDDCIFVFDTNVLLVPYNTGSQSFEEIKRVFRDLKKKGSLKIPGQVAREFANNRPKKLGTVLQQLSVNKSKITKLEIDSYPIFENEKEYEKLLKQKEEINNQIKEFQKGIKSLMDKVKDWQWDDPVSSFYRKLITAREIVDLEIDHADVDICDYKKSDLERILIERYEHGIPPGFKDRAKDDGGIGDLLIWFTILKIAKEKKHVIFVSGDEKNDWFHRSENQSLFPRFELMMEFDRHSEGKSFHIAKLSDLLEMFNAKQAIVEEVKEKEIGYFSVGKSIVINEQNNFRILVKRAALQYWSSKYNDGTEIVASKNFPTAFNFPEYAFVSERGGRTTVMTCISFFKEQPSQNIFGKIQLAIYEVRMTIHPFDVLDLIVVSKEINEDFINLSKHDFSTLASGFNLNITFCTLCGSVLEIVYDSI